MKSSIRYCCLFVYLVITTSVAMTQSAVDRTEIDSLLARAAEPQMDTLRHQTLEHLAIILTDIHPDSALMYGRRAVALTTKIDELPHRIEAYRVLGKVHFQQNRLDSAAYFARRAVDLGQECEDRSCHLQLLNSVKFLREPLWPQSAFEEVLTAFTNFQDIPGLDEELHFESRRLMSYALIELGDFDGALRELKLVKEYSKATGNGQMLCNLYGELINVYLNFGQFEKAITIAHERVAVCQPISASSTAHATMQLASVYEADGQLDSAYFYYQQTLATGHLGYFNAAYLLGGLTSLAQKLAYPVAQDHAAALREYLKNDHGSKRLLVPTRQFIQGSLSRYYLAEGQFAAAHALAVQRLEDIRQSEQDTTELMADALMLVANTQAGLKDYESAWTTFNEYHRYRMAVVNRTQQDALARTAVEMDLADNLLAKERAEETALLERQAFALRSRLFLVLLGLAGALVVVLLWAFRRARRDQRLIQTQNILVEQSLAEKEVLLREIHHRVKNNLQIISSLLNKQARKSSDVAVRQVIQEGQDRIQSMALIHQNLYESDHLSGIDIKNYLKELSLNIQRSQAIDQDQITLELNVEQEKLDIDTAIPVGLILNELLTNCYKYAFPEKRSGKISVNFKQLNGKYHLGVSDNGIGFPPEATKNKTKSLGLSLVKGLVRQLNGSIDWREVERGTAVTIAF